MGKIDFTNVGFIYKFWYKIFMTLEMTSPFSILRSFIFKSTKAFSDKWVLANALLSFLSLIVLHKFNLPYISTIIVIYAFIRILEIVVYQINVLLFHPYKALIEDGKFQYKIQNPYRTVVLLGHNFLEVILWFTCVSNFINKPNERLMYNLMDNTIRIFTFNYEKVGTVSNLIQFIFFIEVICGILLTVISLAKFVGELPHQDITLEDGNEYRNYFMHESSYIDEPCEIGEGTKIWHFSHIMNNSKIGGNCNIGQNVVISSNVIIGNNVKIQNNVSLYTGVVCEDDVFLGPSCVFTNVINPRSFIERKDEYRETIVKKGASIGANATIVCGNDIGRYAFIGAGSIVTKDVDDYALVIGNPAKMVGYICRCGNRLKKPVETYICEVCESEYELRNENLIPKE